MTAFPNDKERDVRAYLKAQVKALGGEVRKVSWFPRTGAPDELVLIPKDVNAYGYSPTAGRNFFVELKKPGEEPKPHQLREHAKLRAAGCVVHVIDCREAVDAVLRP